MKKRTIILLLPFVALTACVLPASPERPKDGTVYLELSIELPQAVGSASTKTRTAVSPTDPDGTMSNFSMCVIPDVEANAEWYHKYVGYDNIQGRPTWNTNNTFSACPFRPRGVTTNMTRIGFFPTKGSIHLYAVYPYLEDFHERLNDLDHIPFTIGKTAATNYDYMYMNPIYLDMTDRVPGEILAMTVPFRHVMTTLEVRLETTMVGTVVVDSLVLDAFDGAERAKIFAMQGSYSAKNGAVYPDGDSYIDHFPITFNTTLVTPYSVDPYSPFSFIFPTVEHKPGRKIVATIYFRYIGDGTLDLVGQSAVMEFPFDNILTEGVNQGFVAGYRYIYAAYIDNFIKYSGYPEIEEWVLPTDEDGDEQIKDIVI